MNSNDPRSIDFAYKKYSLEQLDNWVNDSLNCEDITPETIYDTIVKVVDESIEYHKKHLTRSIELLSLLKGQYDYTATGEKFPETTGQDWEDFWSAEQYSEEDLNAMCDAAEDKEKCREYNLREAEYYNKRAEFDAEYERMTKAGYTLTDEGFWNKKTEKGEASVSTKPDPYVELIKNAGGYEWTPEPPKKKVRTYQDMVNEGWTMTADGFWIKEPQCEPCEPCDLFSPE